MKFTNFSIAVYCASSAKVSPIYLQAAKEIAEIFTDNNIHCVYGAGDKGLMGVLADTILAKKGKITGVIPQFMVERDWHHKGLENMVETDSMHERKAKMASIVDAAIALPGGCGTLEELLEIITWKQLLLFNKPIIIVNINGYFNPLIEMLNKAVEEQFMRKEHSELWSVVSSPKDILQAIKDAPITNENNPNFAVV